MQTEAVKVDLLNNFLTIYCNTTKYKILLLYIIIIRFSTNCFIINVKILNTRKDVCLKMFIRLYSFLFLLFIASERYIFTCMEQVQNVLYFNCNTIFEICKCVPLKVGLINSIQIQIY